ncbi:hypothetical protein SLS60_002466 [Paraconiothyrium brasiliense]|uniref:Uncharacterized protein n=1 Tax=Paraconiothyrium brasiliense TaxID=300254 RepID=A0ABR3S281_9PLEO
MAYHKKQITGMGNHIAEPSPSVREAATRKELRKKIKAAESFHSERELADLGVIVRDYGIEPVQYRSNLDDALERYRDRFFMGRDDGVTLRLLESRPFFSTIMQDLRTFKGQLVVVILAVLGFFVWRNGLDGRT